MSRLRPSLWLLAAAGLLIALPLHADPASESEAAALLALTEQGGGGRR